MPQLYYWQIRNCKCCVFFSLFLFKFFFLDLLTKSKLFCPHQVLPFMVRTNNQCNVSTLATCWRPNVRAKYNERPAHGRPIAHSMGNDMTDQFQQQTKKKRGLRQEHVAVVGWCRLLHGVLMWQRVPILRAACSAQVLHDRAPITGCLQWTTRLCLRFRFCFCFSCIQRVFKPTHTYTCKYKIDTFLVIQIDVDVRMCVFVDHL